MKLAKKIILLVLASIWVGILFVFGFIFLFVKANAKILKKLFGLIASTSGDTLEAIADLLSKTQRFMNKLNEK